MLNQNSHLLIRLYLGIFGVNQESEQIQKLHSRLSNMLNPNITLLNLSYVNLMLFLCIYITKLLKCHNHPRNAPSTIIMW